MNYKMIVYSIARILMILAGAMAIPAVLSVIYGEGYISAYAIPIAVALVFGIAATFRVPKNKSMYTKEGLVIVAVSWILISIIGAFPFYLSGEIPNYVDALFETVSGFTTTGSSILTNVEAMSKSLLFWRSFTHWLGGMGVLVFAMAIFSSKDSRASYVMKAEMPGPVTGKLVSKWQFSVRILYIMYLVLTAAETVLLFAGGMPLFDSILHAFGTAGTGGFGIKNASVGYYDSVYIDWVIGIFMMLFGMNFNIFYLVLIRKFAQIRENDELKWYMTIIIAATFIIGINILPIYETPLKTLRYAFFQVSSIITTTGYSTADFTQWPMLSQMILVLLTVIGGCAGSTSGGMKVIRVMVLSKITVNSVKNTINPRRVFSVKSEGRTVEAAVLRGIMAYLAVYCVMFALSLILVSIDNFDFTTTVSAVLTTINNVGPGLGKVGPAGSFSEFSAFSKIVMSIDMLAGRLELYPILILLMPKTWKRA